MSSHTPVYESISNSLFGVEDLLCVLPLVCLFASPFTQNPSNAYSYNSVSGSQKSMNPATRAVAVTSLDISAAIARNLFAQILTSSASR